MTTSLPDNDSIPLRVLMVEDSQQDAELVLLCLERGGYMPAWQRVETEEDLRAELASTDWDVILSDFTMPHFSGDLALRIANELTPDIPLIVVSGNVGEELAASLMRDGARDYVRKSNLSRLAPTITRELDEARLRQESRKFNEVLDNITGELLPLTGKPFFETLVRVLADSVGMSYVEVCAADSSKQIASSIACFDNGALCEGGECSFATPIISEIISKGSISIEAGLQEKPHWKDFIGRTGLESMVGCTLVGAEGEVIGLLLLLNEKPLSNIHAINSVVKICSVRATAELERTIHEQRLQESERHMRDILRNMQDTLFRVNKDNSIQWVTPSIKELLGYDADEITGKAFEDYFSLNLPEESLHTMLDRNNGRLSGMELPLRHKDGSIVWISVNAQYYFDDKNNIAGIEGVARNITQQRMAEIALRQSEELFSKAFHASPAMIALVQLHENYELGKFIDVNEAFLERCGHDRNDVVGKSVDEIGFFVNHDDQTGFVNQLRSQGYGRDVEFPFRAHNGETYYALGSIELIDIAGSACALSVFQDITFRRRAQEELESHREHLEELVEQRTMELSEAVSNLEIEVKERRQIEQALIEATTRAQGASKAKSEFLANMSHELRTPLNSIIGFTELLMLEPEDVIDADNHEKLTYVLDSAWHLLSLINDILDLSKIEAGKMELDLSEVSLDKLLNSISSLFKEKVDKQCINLTTENNTDVETVYADERKIKQVMFNLVSNAVKFTPESGSISVSMSLSSLEEFELQCGHPGTLDGMHSRFLTVSVTDTGIGIAKEDTEELFMPFKQVDSSVTRKYEGTGLGLHLCRQMIELHGGCIWVESEPGEGSCFSFIIPCGNGQS